MRKKIEKLVELAKAVADEGKANRLCLNSITQITPSLELYFGNDYHTWSVEFLLISKNKKLYVSIGYRNSVELSFDLTDEDLDLLYKNGSESLQKFNSESTDKRAFIRQQRLAQIKKLEDQLTSLRAEVNE